MRLFRYLARSGEERIGTSVGQGNAVDVRVANGLDEPLVDFLSEKGSKEKVESLVRRATDSLRKKNANGANNNRSSSSSSSKHASPTIFREQDVHILTPVRRPGKMICMGGNFSDHLSEGQRDMPPFPISFLKAPTTLVGHRGQIRYPTRRVKLLDYEIELAVVIGAKTKNVSKDDALRRVAGFSVFNDISARDIQSAEMKRGFLNLGKNFDTFGPMGPYLVTPDQAGDPDSLKMELRVNGRTRQLGSTKSMVFKVRELIEFFSSMTLEPGDVITSGTPSGVALHRKPDKMPFMLQPGDAIESEIENLGRLQNTIIDDSEKSLLTVNSAGVSR